MSGSYPLPTAAIVRSVLSSRVAIWVCDFASSCVFECNRFQHTNTVDPHSEVGHERSHNSFAARAPRRGCRMGDAASEASNAAAELAANVTNATLTIWELNRTQVAVRLTCLSTAITLLCTVVKEVLRWLVTLLFGVIGCGFSCLSVVRLCPCPSGHDASLGQSSYSLPTPSCPHVWHRLVAMSLLCVVDNSVTISTLSHEFVALACPVRACMIHGIHTGQVHRCCQ